jgi:hypothetical protein
MQPDQADALVLALRNAARDLVERRSIHDLEQALTQIVAVAVDTVPGVDGGGITMTDNGHITSRSLPARRSASSTISRRSCTKDPASARSSTRLRTVSSWPRT